MRFFYKFCLLTLGALLLSACGQKSAGLQESAVPPDEVLFENGTNFLDKSQYIKARLSFQTLINTYPDSEYTPAAFLSIADSYYKEGGTANLLQAEAQYKDFIIFYPTHEFADDAQLKIAAINYRLMKPHDRDPTYGRKAEIEFQKFLDEYPDSEDVPTAREFLRQVQETLALGIHQVGNFYLERRQNYNASESRYKEVLEKYPRFSLQDANLYHLALSLERAGRIDEATVYYSRVAAEYPFSAYFEEAKDKLILLEKPVPAVNDQAAALHKANLPLEESFSILDPITGVLKIFTGPEDPYEVAKRRAEQREAQNQSYTGDSNGSEGKKN
ncbi:MAG: outer membrane protein assembly factor BamD [Acidobacteriota bacterium]